MSTAKVGDVDDVDSSGTEPGRQPRHVTVTQQRRRVDVSALAAHTHTRLTALFPGLSGWAGTRKVKPIWILLKQETVSGRGISWVICKSAPRSRQITTPAPHHSVFYRPDALPAAKPTASRHWRLHQQQQTKYRTSISHLQIMEQSRPAHHTRLYITLKILSVHRQIVGGSVAEWSACWTQAQKGQGSNSSRDAVG